MRKAKASALKHNHNNEFDNLCAASDYGRLKNNLSPFFTRPIYQYTSMEMGERNETYAQRTHRRRDH